MTFTIDIPKEANIDAIYWLGQAGFWIDIAGTRILIDPYLSNSLAKKYQGKKYPHIRMMPAPIKIKNLPKPDVVLITHGHTDHLDGETLSPLFERYNEVKFIVPKSQILLVKERINTRAQLLGVNTDDKIELSKYTCLNVFPSSHEARQFDEDGQDLFLGYGIEVMGKARNLKLYHSGDTIPFDALSKRLEKFQPDYALLPVNGRDENRKSNGVPGNMTLEEAVDFCKHNGIKNLVPHHYGMFEFNTLDAGIIHKAAKHEKEVKIICPDLTPKIKI